MESGDSSTDSMRYRESAHPQHVHSIPLIPCKPGEELSLSLDTTGKLEHEIISRPSRQQQHAIATSLAQHDRGKPPP